MPLGRKLTTLAVVAFCSLGVSLYGQQPPSFSLTISTPETLVKAGSDIRVDISIRNISNDPISLSVSPNLPEIHNALQIVDDDGNRPPLTKHGHRIMGGDTKPPAQQSQAGSVTKATPQDIADSIVTSNDILFTVEPGKVFKHAIIANKMYDLTTPGKYSIQVRRWDPQSKTFVSSNTIMVTITPATP